MWFGERMASSSSQVEGLVVRRGGGAVDARALKVRRGEHRSTLGPSGCRKTTTLPAHARPETPSWSKEGV